MARGIEVLGAVEPGQEEILSEEALAFVADLARRFGGRRRELLEARAERTERLRAGELPKVPDRPEVTDPGWRVAPAPADLDDRRVEITGPVDRKMMINALNSGAQVFMADFEDSLAPTWANVVAGQVNLRDAVRREISLDTGEKSYELEDVIATLLVRPRGWHLEERHVTVDGRPVSASLFDFGLYFFHNARELVERGSGPYFYLPKLEGHLEARLWNDVFVHAQEALGMERGTVRATVLIETILAAVEMEAILYELRDHAAGFNAGRWDYIFSVIRLFGRAAPVMPDRSQVTMTVPFMRAYTELLVKTCHTRGAHAIGGMSAFIPSRHDEAVNERALAAVRDDKDREAADGFDGSWVAHPDLVPVVAEIFDRHLGDSPHQKERRREEVSVTAADLTDFEIEGGTITEEGFRTDVSVALQYLGAWFNGNGAAAIQNLMEDTATAEISRSQLWQWLHRDAAWDDGTPIDRELYFRVREEEIAELTREEGSPWASDAGRGLLADAAELLDDLVVSERFVDFLTLAARDRLDARHDHEEITR